MQQYIRRPARGTEYPGIRRCSRAQGGNRALPGPGHTLEQCAMTHLLRTILIAGLALLALPASASYHTFQIDEIYSNADGTVQYVVLHESMGMNGQNLLGGHALLSTGAGSMATYVFPFDLPGGSCGYYGCTTAPTARSHVLIATRGFVSLGIMTPDFVMPDG